MPGLILIRPAGACLGRAAKAWLSLSCFEGHTNMKATDLSALVASRLCHDLVSPVGAISNGLEVLADEDDPAVIRQAVDLLGHSVGQAQRKLQFYRLAFGASSAASEDMDAGEIARLAQELLEEGRIRLDWPERPETLAKLPARIFANMILVGEDCLPRGGTLTAMTGQTQIQLTAQGDNCRLREEMAAVFDGSAQAPMPHVAPAVLLSELVAEAGGQLSTETGVSDIGLRVRLSPA